MTVRDRPTLVTASWSSPVLLDGCHPSSRSRRVKARAATACGFGLDAADSAETIEQRGGHASATVTSAGDQVPDVATLKAEGWQFDPPLTTSFERGFSALTSAIRNQPG
jgi:hypothetical protein